jgi:hypothetical protein
MQKPEQLIRNPNQAFSRMDTLPRSTGVGIQTCETPTKLTTPVIRHATLDEIESWDELVEGFGNCRVFHKQSWIRSIESFSGVKPLYLVFSSGEEVVGLLPGFIRKIGPLRIFGSPIEGWQTDSMGPVFDSERVSTRDLVVGLISFLEDNYGTHQIELASPDLDPDAMRQVGFQGKCLATCRIALFPGAEERALKNMQAKTRNQLRKAMKLGLVAKVTNEDSFVEEAFDQVTEVFTRRGHAVPYNKKRFRDCVQHAKDGRNLLAISIFLPDESVNVATGVFLINGREVNLWQWAHRTAYRWYCPTELLLWTAMQKGMEAGCVTLDMSGRGRSKEKFGAVLDTTNYRWIRSRYGWLSALRDRARKAYRLQQSLRGRLQRSMRPQQPAIGQEKK